jgi:hypothetical protein
MITLAGVMPLIRWITPRWLLRAFRGGFPLLIHSWLNQPFNGNGLLLPRRILYRMSQGQYDLRLFRRRRRSLTYAPTVKILLQITTLPERTVQIMIDLAGRILTEEGSILQILTGVVVKTMVPYGLAPVADKDLPYHIGVGVMLVLLYAQVSTQSLLVILSFV